jgi:hypothetical protein
MRPASAAELGGQRLTRSKGVSVSRTTLAERAVLDRSDEALPRSMTHSDDWTVQIGRAPEHDDVVDYCDLDTRTAITASSTPHKPAA